jgi:alpha-D-xyloside xylohydrolase
VTYGQDTFDIFTDTGGSNEVWSFGPEVEAVLVDLLALRERLRPYLGEAFARYARTGDPVMAPLFYHFPDQPALHDRGDAYMLGPDLLVAPVLEAGARARSVALPLGETWVAAWTGAEHPGGTRAEVEAPWGRIPVFIRKGAAARLRPLFAPAD